MIDFEPRSQDSLNNDVVSKALRQSAQYANQISYGQLNDQRTLELPLVDHASEHC
ncbi:hypothetical protein ACT691_03010 [Vibrio metschnikovii]